MRKDGQIVYLEKENEKEKKGQRKGIQGQSGGQNDVLFSAGSTKLNIL